MNQAMGYIISKQKTLFLLVLINCFCNQHILAQILVPGKTPIDSQSRAYVGTNYWELTKNCLIDTPSIVLTTEENNEICKFLEQSIPQKMRALSSIIKKEGLLINDMYLTSRGYAVINKAGWYFEDVRSFPSSIAKDVDSLIRTIIRKSEEWKYARYNHHTSVSCVFLPFRPHFSFGERIKVTFYTAVDSNMVKPISYLIKKDRKNGFKVLMRYIPFWEYYSIPNEKESCSIDSLLLSFTQQKSDSIAIRTLIKWIPSWGVCSEQERMHLLDDNYAKNRHRAPSTQDYVMLVL